MTSAPANTLVWGEVPVRDLDRAMAFYGNVFGFEMSVDESGPNPMSLFSYQPGGAAGHLYPGEPAAPGTGPTLHLLVPDMLEDAAGRCEKAGGTIKSDPIPLPMGRFQYALDPDGNSIGLFEAAKA